MIKSALLASIIGLVASLWYALPLLKPFPQLSGSSAVGIKTVYFTDDKRAELFSKSPTDKRTIVGHIFFPANNDKNLQKAPYLDSKMPFFLNIFSSHFRIPKELAHLFFRNIKTNAYRNAPLANTKSTYPVVLFSHGLLGMPSDMYTVLLEDLASHGYIVIGIDHPYLNMLTLYSNGKAVTCGELAKEFERMSPSEQKKFQNEAIDVYKADIQFMLDQLALMNQDQNSIFYNRLDLDTIAIIGHSAGGTASIEFCRNDNRCKAAIDLDGWYDQAIGDTPLQQPLLLLFGAKSLEVTEPTSEYLKRKQLTREEYFEREKNIAEHRKNLCAAPNCLLIILPGVQHGDFGDNILLKWPFRGWNDADPYTTITLINKTILQFLNTYLAKARA